MAPIRLSHVKNNENELNKASDGNINSNKIDNKITNLLSTIKKMSFKTGFLISKTCLTFTQLRKLFIEALILHYFNL